MRISSPFITLGRKGSTSMMNLRPLSPARLLSMFMISFSTELKAYSTGMISMRPDSIFEKSRISFMRESRLLPAPRIFSAYSRVKGSFVSRRIISSMPSTAFIGVRISWLMFERNWDFAIFAASAFCTR